MDIILRDIDPDDFALASRAARWFLGITYKPDAIIAIPTDFGTSTKDFYVCSYNKNIIVRNSLGITR